MAFSFLGRCEQQQGTKCKNVKVQNEKVYTCYNNNNNNNNPICKAPECQKTSVALNDFRGVLLVGCVAQLAERRSSAGKLILCCARPAADHYVGKPSATGQPTMPTHSFILSG